ncbi:MAG: transglutaminase family protein [Desulfosalsimonadaceae bacterium]|nr:transglutaminase family protein [Desulfosalsimonadaceae bacterium]
MQPYLAPTPFLDHHHPLIQAFVEKHASGEGSPRLQAVRLYYAVRDGIRYDPYSIDMTVDGLKATTTLATGRGWCVAKSILLAACCRSLHIPARLGFADVRNHLSTVRMRELMKTDIFYWHGYASLYLDGQWVKATPAFNIGLCEKFHLMPLDFDGTGDSIYHPFDLDGNRHMEYLHDRGTFADVPLDNIIHTFQREYVVDDSLKKADFEKDVDAEM